MKKRMAVIPANSTGLWHCLARETGLLGHLYSISLEKKTKQWKHTARGPWGWFPYRLDNGAYAWWKVCGFGAFDYEGYEANVIPACWSLWNWAATQTQQPVFVIVPDCPGNWEMTKRFWAKYAPIVRSFGFVLAIAVQDGATVEDVLALEIQPEVICIGGTTEWKWETVEMWAKNFSRVHLLRCAAPTKYPYLESLGIESVDATMLNAGDKKQTAQVEAFVRRFSPHPEPIHPYMCRHKPIKGSGQEVLI